MFKVKALYKRLLTVQIAVPYFYNSYFRTWGSRRHACLRETEGKVNSCYYFRTKKIWQNEGGGHATIHCLLEDVAHPPLPLRDERLFLPRHSGSAHENRVKTPALQLFIERRQQHMRMQPMRRQTASPVCFISPFSSSSHAKPPQAFARGVSKR